MNTDNNYTTFHKIDGKLLDLTTFIETGDLALPELQRPFVWSTKKVRDLFDSMYKGFPIGYFVFWENERAIKTHQIGKQRKIHNEPKYLIIDGQQRLTAIYSVFNGREIVDKNYQSYKIKIAFNPLTEEFMVSNASTSRNKEFIHDISEVYQGSSHSFITKFENQLESYVQEVKVKRLEVARKFKKKETLNLSEIEFTLARLRAIPEPTEQVLRVIPLIKKDISLLEEDNKWITRFLRKQIIIDKEKVAKRIEKLAKLTDYPYQALEIFLHVDEENVADIFTRINSKGVSLNQSDFVLTLISVFWDDGRKQIDQFCRMAKMVPELRVKESPFNYIMRPEAQDIVRAVIGVGFKRGRMKDAYALLKGRNMATRKYSVRLRNQQFAIYQEKQMLVLDNKNWHTFLKIILGLGFKTGSLISSSVAVINAYIFYLIGKTEYHIGDKELEKIIGRWFFMSNLTSRYSGSSETIMDGDLNKVKGCINKKEFFKALDDTIKATLTNDFWNITLPKDLLITSSGNSPIANTFYACLIKNNVNALFSERKVSDLYDPNIKTKKKSLDKHHLFPKNYLAKKKVEKTQINQIANLTYLEYLDNIDISDDKPSKYFNRYLKKYFKGKEKQLQRCMTQHALPKHWYDMEYKIFLEKRRMMIGKVLRNTFGKI